MVTKGIHRHSGAWRYRAPATKTVQKINLIKSKINIGGKPVRVLICSKCLKAQEKGRR